MTDSAKTDERRHDAPQWELVYRCAVCNEHRVGPPKEVQNIGPVCPLCVEKMGS